MRNTLIWIYRGVIRWRVLTHITFTLVKRTIFTHSHTNTSLSVSLQNWHFDINRSNVTFHIEKWNFTLKISEKAYFGAFPKAVKLLLSLGSLPFVLVLCLCLPFHSHNDHRRKKKRFSRFLYTVFSKKLVNFSKKLVKFSKNLVKF